MNLTKKTARNFVGFVTAFVAVMSIAIGAAMYGVITNASGDPYRNRSLFNVNQTVNDEVVADLMKIASDAPRTHDNTRAHAGHIRSVNYGMLPSYRLFEPFATNAISHQTWQLAHITYPSGGSPVFTFWMNDAYAFGNYNTARTTINNDFAEMLSEFTQAGTAIVTPADMRIGWQHGDMDVAMHNDMVWLPSQSEIYIGGGLWNMVEFDQSSTSNDWLRTSFDNIKSWYVTTEGYVRTENKTVEFGLRPAIHITLQDFVKPSLYAINHSAAPDASIISGDAYRISQTSVLATANDGITALTFNAGNGYFIGAGDIKILGVDIEILDWTKGSFHGNEIFGTTQARAWYTDPSRQVAVVEVRDIDAKHVDWTNWLYVDASSRPVNYKISFDVESLEGVTPIPQVSYTIASGFDGLVTPKYINQSKVFGHWAFTVDGNPVHEIPAGTTGDIVLYAVWVAPSAPQTPPQITTPTDPWTEWGFTMTYNYGNGATSIYTVNRDGFIDDIIMFGEAITLETPTSTTPDKTTFGGWYLEPNFVTPFVHTTMPAFPHDNYAVNIYARWISIASYAIQFNAMGGTNVQSQVMSLGEYPSQPVSPTRNGHTFAGWYTTTTCTTAFNFNKVYNNLTTAFAKWVPNVWRVDFNLNGGEWVQPFDYDPSYGAWTAPASVYHVAFGVAIPVPQTPVRQGYVFDGWSQDLDTTMPNHNISVFAKWVTDTAKLQSVVSTMERHIADQGYYTSASFAMFKDAIDNANHALSRPITHQQTLSHITALNKAYADLKININVIANFVLYPIVPQTGARLDYTKITWASYQSWVTASESAKLFIYVGQNNIQAVKHHEAELREVLTNLAQNGTTDKSELFNIMVFLESKSEFATALANAIAVYDNPLASQTQVNFAIEAALKALDLDDFAQLSSLNAKNFTKNSFSNYIEKRDAVEEILESPNMKFSELTVALDEYNAAVTSLQSVNQLDMGGEQRNTGALAAAIFVSILALMIGGYAIFFLSVKRVK